MPNYRWSLTAPRPKPGYPKQLKDLGDHLKARRRDLGLTQKEVAARLAVDADTIRNWEVGRSAPAVRHYPALLTFLAFDFRPEQASLAQKIRHERMRRGWSARKLASISGIDEATVRRLERGVGRITKRVVHAICDALGRLRAYAGEAEFVPRAPAAESE